LLRRITVGLLNNDSSAIEPKRSADDREAAPTSPLFPIITVIGRPPVTAQPADQIDRLRQKSGFLPK
jgi:hypothetical protein